MIIIPHINVFYESFSLLSHLGLSAHRYQTARIRHCGPDDHVDHVHDGHVGHDGHDCTAAG